MAEFHESHRETPFLRPLDSLTPPGPKFRATRLSQPNRLPVQESRKPPPPEPVPIPSPHPKARGIAELNQNINPQYAGVDPRDSDIESSAGFGDGLPSTPEGERRTFGGALMSGWRALSKSMMRDRGSERSHVLPPGYDSPGRPGTFYVQVSQEPVVAPAPAAIRQHHSPSRDSRDRHKPLDLHNGETAAVHHESSPLRMNPVNLASAEAHSSSSEYSKMDVPDVHGNIPLHARVAAVQKFFRDLHDLPWVATHVAADYIPGQSTPRHRTVVRPPVASWYSQDRHHSVDLFSGGSTPRSSHPPAPSGSNPGPTYGADHRSPKTSKETPVVYTEARGYPMYPHGYAPPSLLPAQYVVSTGRTAGQSGFRPVVPVHPQGARD
jgi:hypothetical protein